MPDDDMGRGHAGVDDHGTSITNKTFEAAAKGEGMSPKEAKKNTLDLLKRILLHPHYKAIIFFLC